MRHLFSLAGAIAVLAGELIRIVRGVLALLWDEGSDEGKLPAGREARGGEGGANATDRLTCHVWGHDGSATTS